MKVNGKESKLKESILLYDYLEQLGYRTDRIAVERNGLIVPRDNYKKCVLSDSDTLEIVHFVGGG
ncbi:MAG: sulfur carrier protein ThiS [Lachnospiraceae bacterium]|jgi:thiamine biosynthesis protein ThiS|nr:sulfur carrier protein ThiS [Lachnospiraceae bacterium]MCI8824968.1 sulfur carrier protein ThiS [Lachnospiraceae bacterium]MCI9370299.1 sulfur carrier protein ThiS [Lachnospiraceae bacterium]MDE7307172.1 sulfur carrier protein ThiS [Lachnospiraceae bacterium]